MLYRKLINKDIIVVFFFVLLCAVLFFIPTGFEQQAPNSYLAKAKVLNTDDSAVQQTLIVKVGTQELDVELLEGQYKGQQATVVNPLTGKMEFDQVYAKGNTILVEYTIHEGKIKTAYARGHYRLNHELLLVAMFCGFIILVAGWTGVKAILSFLFAALMIWKILIPCFLKDYDPILIALAVVAALTGSVSFLIGGFSRKGWTTFIGSFSGLLLACFLAKVFSTGFHLHGAVRPFSEALLYQGYPHLNLTGIFIAGIFIACSGAVMDLAMDISASMDEIKHNKPDIKTMELVMSGLRVGRSVIGTMTTTLLLAYSGGYTAMMMHFMHQGLPIAHIFNLNYVAAEVLNVFVGSFGLVAVAPFTAIAGAIIFHFDSKSDVSDENTGT